MMEVLACSSIKPRVKTADVSKKRFRTLPIATKSNPTICKLPTVRMPDFLSAVLVVGTVLGYTGLAIQR
jgi:hypothetical protein